MNELEQTLAEILKKSLELAEKTGDFVIDQAPQLLQEFYMWHTSKFILGVILGLLLLLTARFINNLWSKKYNGEEKDWDKVILFGRIGEQVNMILPFSIITLFGLIVLCINVYNLIFILVAPKLYLIEYFMHV